MPRKAREWDQRTRNNATNCAAAPTYPNRCSHTDHITGNRSAGLGFCLQELLLLGGISGKWAQITQLLLLLPPPPFPKWILHHLHLFVSSMFSLMSWVGGSDWWSSGSVSGPQRTLKTQERGFDAGCWRQVLQFHSNPFLSSNPHFLRNHCSNSVLNCEIEAVVSLLHSHPSYLNMRLILCRALVTCMSFTAISILNNRIW